MNTEEKKEFTEHLIKAVRDKVLCMIDEFPETWDEIELRWLIKEKFNQVTHRNKRSKRFEVFENDCIVNNWF